MTSALTHRSLFPLVMTLVLASGCTELPATDAGTDREVTNQLAASASALSSAGKPEVGRVALCHLVDGGTRHPITIAAAAVPAHLAHGDSVGECPSQCASAATCDDGNACTADDCATNGVCRHVVVSCDDSDPCTADACDALTGCTTVASAGGACNDGNDCTASDQCVAGICRGSAIAGCCRTDAECADDDGCTRDQCFDRSCKNQPIACTVADACIVGFCDPVAGACASAPITCNDSNACTADSCDAALGCRHAAIEGCDASSPCPLGMMPVDSFCVDKYEATLLEVHDDGSTSPWPSDLNPELRRMVAVSLAGVVPQTFISEVQASAACAQAGKRLCTDVEWLRACRGASSQGYPYGNSHMDGACNDGIDQSSTAIAMTGQYPACVSAEQVNDLFGNVNEWTAAAAGTSRGGSHLDSQLNGPGCSYAITAHDTSHFDERTGFRCCADL